MPEAPSHVPADEPPRFDPRERACIGLNFLNRNLDRSRGCLPYFWTRFGDDSAEMRHDWPDFGDLTARYVGAFVMARRMTGDKMPGEVELALRRLLLSYFDEGDGLSYRPRVDRPYYSTISHGNYDAHVAEGFDQSRVLWGLLAWYGDTGDPAIRGRIADLVAGLDRVMVKRKDYGYYDRAAIEPGAVIPADAPPMPHPVYFCGAQIHPLVECWRRLGMNRAGDLAGRLARFLFLQSDYFFEDGCWRVGGSGGFETAETDGHSHARLAAIAGTAHWARLSGDRELTDRARRAYDWFVHGHCADFGWSPEFLGRGDIADEACETCVVMDQIHCALAFAEAGDAGQYEKVERIARNQLLENQLLDTSCIRSSRAKPDTQQSSFTDVAGRVRGGFAGWAGVNDLIGPSPHSRNLMNCCGPSGIHALYDVWSRTAHHREGTIVVRFFLDHEGDLVTLHNGQPREGVLDIVPHHDATLQLQRRSWLPAGRLHVTVRGRPRQAAEVGEILDLGAVRAGDAVRVVYPLEEAVQPVHVNGRDFTVTWRGDTVVCMDPPGRNVPLYRGRTRVREDAGRP